MESHGKLPLRGRGLIFPASGTHLAVIKGKTKDEDITEVIRESTTNGVHELIERKLRELKTNEDEEPLYNLAGLPDDALGLLDVLVGTWELKGENLMSGEDNLEISGTETYEWISGEFFLMRNYNRNFAGVSYEGVCIIGFDPCKTSLYANSYDNIGYVRKYKIISINERTWKFKGEREQILLEISPDYKSFTETCNISVDNKKWQKQSLITATKM